MKISISDNTFISVVSLLIVAAIATTAYAFLIRKDYDFVIEEQCDASSDTCFYRDCSVDECPPNGLEYYRVFSVAARDFEQCSNESCLEGCITGAIECTEVVCGESAEDVCAE